MKSPFARHDPRFVLTNTMTIDSKNISPDASKYPNISFPLVAADCNTITILWSLTGCATAPATRYKKVNKKTFIIGYRQRITMAITPPTPTALLINRPLPYTVSITLPAVFPRPGIPFATFQTALFLTRSITGTNKPWIP